jgi:tetratricopeptide (TPR) repeat protein
MSAMRTAHAVVALVSVILAGWTTGVAARSVRGDDKACADTADADGAIAACTRLYENTGLGKRNRAIALGNRGAAYKSLGRYPEAIADFDEASELDPKNPQYLCQRGDVRIRTNEFDAAIGDYTTALGFQPRMVWALQGRGRAYLAKNDGAPAVADFNAALRLKPGDFILLTQRGRASNLTQQYDVAVADLSKAMGHEKFADLLPKERSDLLAQRGYAYIKQGNSSAARADADEALRLLPKSAFAIGVSGLIDEKEGQTERAKDAFTRALAIDPALTLAKLGLERIGGGGAPAPSAKVAEPEKSDAPAKIGEPEKADAPKKADAPVTKPEPVARTEPREEPLPSADLCAKYVPEIGRTVKVKCAE